MSELLYGKPQKRIVEYIDSEGKSTFVPQRKFLWWWLCYETYPYGPAEFPDFDSCKAWLLYERCAIQRIHAV